METFITKICVIDGATETCQFGGVLPYIGVLMFLLTVFGFSYMFIKYIINKTI